ncbi:PD-(D/E)XK nuclease family protein [Nocardioides sp. BGMRC 2183]|nr:PD-(D/E)XK nuclease family protein [Nocardioides sp. BGMRC 2183]
MDTELAPPPDGGVEPFRERWPEAVGSLSPSRAGDFVSCPLLYRFRTVDRLPERPSVDAARGTLVHKVLEDLFDRPPEERTPVTAAAMLEPAWKVLVEEEPELTTLFERDGIADETALAAWLASCRAALERYFALEDPRRLEPADRELYLESMTDSLLVLRGIIDRVDLAADGAIRVVDYKSGRSPREGSEARALFQLKFYALLLWRTRGVVPHRLQLMYLGDGQIVSYDPDEQDLVATERKVEAIWEAISLARETGEWLPSPGALCRWCDHQALCPAFGGTPPPLPEAPASSG